jgi:hypothetical protein
MKWTDLALLWTFVFFSFTLIHESLLEREWNDLQRVVLYHQTLKSALLDAAYSLTWDAEGNIERAGAARQFFRSLSYSLQAGAGVDRFVPFLLAVDRDGYAVCAQETYMTASGTSVRKHLWQPKRYFVHADGHGNVLALTLTGSSSVYLRARDTWLAGNRETIFAQSHLPVMETEERFVRWKETVMMNQLERDLNQTLNQYLHQQRGGGGFYRLHFPKTTRSLARSAVEGNSLLQVGLVAVLVDTSTLQGENVSVVFSSVRLKGQSVERE